MTRAGVLGALLLAAATPAGAVQLIRVPEDLASLQVAIEIVGHGGVIELSGGTYAPPVGGFVVSDLGKAFTIRAAAGAEAVLDGADGASLLRVMNSSPEQGGPVTFERLVFARGRSLTDGLAGGVTLSRADATFVDCVFRDCWSDANQTGGGGAAVFSDSRAVFVRCQWLDNWASNEGGGLRVGEGSRAWVHESVFARNLTNRPNHRSTAAGGAIHVGNSELVLTNTRLDSNQAGYVGGGLYVIGTWSDPVSTPSAAALVANCTFVDNRAVPDPSVSLSFPTEGGAVHAEDQATLAVLGSRFVGNSADNGGGVNLYRAVVTLEECLLEGNRATSTVAGRGFGGALCVLSCDTSGDGGVNRRSGQLAVRDTLVRGRSGGVTTVAQLGGGLFSTGDQCRRYGLGGVTPTASASATRAAVSLERVAFADCDVLQSTTGGSWGGGLDVTLTDLEVDRALVVGSDAVSAGGSPVSGGGGARVIQESEASFAASAFVANTGLTYGGGLYAVGARTDLEGCAFVDNDLGGASAFGRAMFTGPLQSVYGVAMDAAGVVEGTTFSGGGGEPVFDNDAESGAVNDLRYDGNTFHRAGSSLVYVDDIEGVYDVPGLNALVVSRLGGRTTDKSLVANVWAASPPVVGAVLAVPPRILPTVAAGDLEPSGEAFLALAWGGGGATLDGAALAGSWAVLEAGEGTHTLEVAGTPFAVAVTAAPRPAATFTATPAAIASGQSATLSWAVTGGTFLDLVVDQGVAAAPAASGSVVVSPTASTTYRLVVATREGGVVEEVRVLVDEPGIFADGFASGTTAAWSVTAP